MKMPQIVKALAMYLRHVSLMRHFRLSSKPDSSFSNTRCRTYFPLKLQGLMHSVRELLFYSQQDHESKPSKYKKYGGNDEECTGNSEVRTTFSRGHGGDFPGWGT